MRIEAALICTAVTTMREKAGEDVGPIRKALTLDGPVDVDAVLPLFATQKDRDSFSAKYWDGDKKLLIAHLADHVTLDVEITGGIATMWKGMGKSGRQEFKGVDIRKIRLRPEEDRKVNLTLALHVNPTEPQCGRLDYMLGTEVSFIAERAQAEMELKPPAAVADDDQAQIPLSDSLRKLDDAEVH